MELKKVCLAGFILFSAVNFAKAQVGFVDQSALSRIDNVGSNHGVSFGDFNNDGLEDAYVVVRESGVPNKLYINRGNGTFEDVGELAGVNTSRESTAATWGDINNDGWLDLYVGNTGAANTLYLNNGDQTFTDITIMAGVGDPFDPRSVQFVDVDNDGLLDIYVHNFNTQNFLYKNNGNNTFTDVSRASGALDLGPAMGTIFFDMDGDGDQDLYLTNDGTRNVLYENVGDGKFEDVSEGSGLDIHCSCMGVDFGDMDHDGDWDIYITNYGVNFLFENNGDGTFTDMGAHFDVNDHGMGWGTFWFDYDNDGDQDIYLANHEFISSRPNMLYRNNNGGESFEFVSAGSNIEAPYASFGTAAADVNNDGFLDIFVANWGESAPNQLFMNENENNNSILVKAIGTESNAAAIGATVMIRTGDKVQMDQVNAATGYASQSSLVLHFGVGGLETIDEMIIKWPSGIEESYTNLPVNSYFTVTERQGMETEDLGRSVVASTEGNEPERLQSYPNPFSESTFIPVSPGLGRPSLEIYTPEGHKVSLLTETEEINGETGFLWNGTNNSGSKVTGGLYIFKVADANSGLVRTGKVILSRR